MSFLRDRHQRCLFTSAIVLPLCIAAAGCGGGGGGEAFVASIPSPPVTPTPTPTPAPAPNPAITVINGYTLANTLAVETSLLPSPATRPAKYDLIGRLQLTPGNGDPTVYRTTQPGEFGLTVGGAPNGLTYTLNAQGILPGGLSSLGPTSAPATSWDINAGIAYRYNNPYEDWVQSFGQRLTAFDKATDGSQTPLFSFDFVKASMSSSTSLDSGKSVRSEFHYDIGYSSVAMGDWQWRVVDLNGASAGDFGNLLFVNGDRTATAGIPVSGTATYDAHSLALLSSSRTAGIPFSLTADFGQRTISTRIDQDYRYNAAGGADGDPALGIHVGGSAPFSADGLFAISLLGTATYTSRNDQIAPPSEAVTGKMNGAFFGPTAEQVGGAFSIERPSGVLLMQDAFIGQQRRP